LDGGVMGKVVFLYRLGIFLATERWNNRVWEFLEDFQLLVLDAFM